MLRVPQGNQSYPWENNSCWLDTALELLHATVSYNFDAFAKACELLPRDSPFQELYGMLLARQTQKSTSEVTLSQQRNDLRTTLVSVNLAASDTSYEAIFVSQFAYCQLQ